jgi:hypothetical protein
MLLDVVEPLVARGAVGEAEALLARFAGGEFSDDPQSQAGWSVARSRVALARGDAATARDAAAEALAAGRKVGAVGTPFKLAVESSLESTLAGGGREGLAPLLAEIDALPPGHRTPWLRALRARIAGHLGELGEFATAEALYRELGMRFRLGQVLLECAEATGDDRRLAEARELFAELGATVWIERAHAAEHLVTTS